MAEQLMLNGTMPEAKWQSYIREVKLKVIHFYHNNDKKLVPDVQKKFSLNTKTTLDMHSRQGEHTVLFLLNGKRLS
jgi:ABC-type transport system involved in Fe-S cluster assembly fused permease/ATPase subunit